MVDYHEELRRAVADGSLQKISAAAAHVDADTLLGTLRFAVFQEQSRAVIEQLVKHAGQHNLSSVLLMALHRNHLEAFDVVWNYVDCYVDLDHRQLLREAVLRGHSACVQKLLRVHPLADDFGAQLLAHACFNQDAEMVDVLYDVCNPQAALDILHNDNARHKTQLIKTQLIVQRMEQEKLRAHLESVTQLREKSCGVRKI